MSHLIIFFYVPYLHRDENSLEYLALANVTTSTECITFQREILIDALPIAVARSLALVLFPEDPEAMIKASKRLPGRMTSITKYCDLETVRLMGNKMVTTKANDYSSGDIIMERAIASSLTADEKMVTSSLLKNMPPFDISLAWSLGRELFKSDKVIILPR